MHVDNLVKMANQIGSFFESMPDPVEAREGIANHIKKFWEPRMRRQFLEAIDGGSATELHEIVRAAVDSHRALLA